MQLRHGDADSRGRKRRVRSFSSSFSPFFFVSSLFSSSSSSYFFDGEAKDDADDADDA